jgi:DNA-binding IclR family transcriptional regulator
MTARAGGGDALEGGVTVALEPLLGSINAAICVAMPTVRFRRAMLGSCVAALNHAACAIGTAD